MSIRSLRGVVVGLVVVGVVAATAPAAEADTFLHRDASGDVVVQMTDNESGEQTYYAGPRRTAPDLVQLTVVHERSSLSIATTVRALNEAANNWFVSIVTSKGDEFTLQRSIGPDIGTTPVVLLTRNDERFECRGLHVSRTSSGIIAKVPTRCLGTPWKVRVGVQAISLDEKRPFELQAQDDVLRVGKVDYGRPSMSAWIAR